jgi:hypothetical protein
MPEGSILEAQDEPHEPDYYNAVFERLVDAAQNDADKLIGIVAYGLYKIGKRQWIVQFRREFGRRPTDTEVRAHGKTQVETVLDGYRTQAASIVAAYTGTVLDSERPKIVAEARKGSFKQSFWPSYVASAAFAATLAILAFVLYWTGIPMPLGG